jgi:hypothetical protein
MEFSVRTETGAFDLEAAVRFVGSDLLVAVWGGERPHIGAVAVAQPRPSLRAPAKTSASTSVFCFVGHKEDELAKAAAEVLAAMLDTAVVVTAGIHWDDLGPEGIRAVVRNSEGLIDLILEKIVGKGR